jgi:hypothetical protein
MASFCRLHDERTTKIKIKKISLHKFIKYIPDIKIIHKRISDIIKNYIPAQNRMPAKVGKRDADVLRDLFFL